MVGGRLNEANASNGVSLTLNQNVPGVFFVK